MTIELALIAVIVLTTIVLAYSISIYFLVSKEERLYGYAEIDEQDILEYSISRNVSPEYIINNLRLLEERTK